MMIHLLKKYRKLTSVIIFLMISLTAFTQSSENNIKTGFYIRFGPLIPIGEYSDGQYSSDPIYYGYPYYYDYRIYPYAKVGISSELGSHFYIGPSMAKGKLRVGIDVTFMNFMFNRTNSDDLANWYWFISQKVGPILTISPVKDFYLDIGFKLTPIVGYNGFYEDWGRHINEEVIFNIRFHQATLSFQIDPGSIRYDNFTDSGDLISISTFRILLGMTF
jgi:hypothetical protein